MQRVGAASVTIDGSITAAINTGFLVLLGVAIGDDETDATWLAGKIAQLRICADENGLMNNDIKQSGGDVLVVSQFTLQAAYKKGNRPSFIKAARPEQAIPLYEGFVATLQSVLGKPVYTGTFGADMQVSLVNDGPVTIIMDSRNRE